MDERVAMTGVAAQLPRSNGDLVFTAPWESRAFGMAVALHAQGAFQWPEFQERLVEEWPTTSHDRQDEATRPYYDSWLRAFQRLLIAKGLATPDEITAMATRVRDDAAHTDPRRPHDEGRLHR